MTCCLKGRSLVTLRSWLNDGLGLYFGEERAKHKSRVLGLSVNLPHHPQLWSQALDSDRKNEIADRSDKITVLWRVDSLCLCNRMEEFSHWGDIWIRATAPSHQKEAAEVILACDLDALWIPPGWGVSGMSCGEEAPGQSRARWRDCISQLAWK